MVKTVLTVLTIIYLLHIIYIYHYEIIPRLIWANETLYLNYDANRQAWRACKRGLSR